VALVYFKVEKHNSQQESTIDFHTIVSFSIYFTSHAYYTVIRIYRKLLDYGETSRGLQAHSSAAYPATLQFHGSSQ
jgi:hypothetical protein